jgi:hypothetical protein
VPEPAGGQAGMKIGMPNIPDARVSTTFVGAISIPFRS